MACRLCKLLCTLFQRPVTIALEIDVDENGRWRVVNVSPDRGASASQPQDRRRD